MLLRAPMDCMSRFGPRAPALPFVFLPCSFNSGSELSCPSLVSLVEQAKLIDEKDFDT